MRFASSTRLSVWGRRGARTSVALWPLVVGCGLSLDLSPPDPRRGDGAVEIDGGTLDGGETDGSFDARVDGSRDGDVDAWMPPDAGSCVEVSECEMRERSGAPTTCEAWACVAGRCVENDYDGDGFGPGCEDDRDCDDFDPTITLDGVVSCPDDLSRPGICGASAYRTCTAGVLSPMCEGFLDPLAAEACNGEDDDCDGTVDEALPSTTIGEGRCAETLSCVEGALATTSPAVPANDGCVGPAFEVDDDCDGRVDEDCVPDDCEYVRLGEGEDATGTAAEPHGRLSAAIAAAVTRGTNRVCLLANGNASSCTALAYTMPTVTTSSDLTIVGGLVASEAGVVSECPQGAEATSLSPMSGAGIAIPSGLTLTLRDLVVRHPVATSGTVQALEVRTGGTLVMHNVRVRGSDAAGVTSVRRGVLVRSGGTFVAHASRIESGPAATAYAIDATDATVALLEGCGARGCVPTCSDLNHGVATNRIGAAIRSVGGELLVDRVAVCVDRAPTGIEVSGTARAAIVRSFVEMGPDLAGVVRSVNASSCTSLWVHDTRVETLVGGAEDDIDVVGIDATSCPAWITDNEVVGVRTFSERQVGKAYGVRCSSTACTVTGNVATGASSGEGVLEAFGLACVSGCGYVAQNTFLGAGVFTQEATGMLLDSTRATVTRNRAAGGCGELVVGAEALGGGLRLTNNELIGVHCDQPPSLAAGLAVEARAGASFSSHGNSYDAGRLGSADVDCSSAGLALRAEARFGSFVNDVLVAGECAFARAAIVESQPPAFFFHVGLVGTFYEVVDDRVYADAASLAATYPLFVGHVFTSTPRFADRPASLRIQATSPFVGAGTRLGGPRIDFDGSPRPSPPSIGAWEP